MGELFQINISGIEEISEKISEYGVKASDVIRDYLKTDAYDRISAHIPDLIHASGRTWKGKRASATQASPSSVFKPAEVSGLTLIVRTQTRYHYLYFPDDGSNTSNHYGNQQFMLRGAEEVTDEIISDLQTRLVQAFED